MSAPPDQVDENAIAIFLNHNEIADAANVAELITAVCEFARQPDQLGEDAIIELRRVATGTTLIELAAYATILGAAGTFVQFGLELERRMKERKNRVANAIAVLMADNGVTDFTIATKTRMVTVARSQVEAVKELEASRVRPPPVTHELIGNSITTPPPIVGTAALQEYTDGSDVSARVGFFRREGRETKFEQVDGERFVALKDPLDTSEWPMDRLVLVEVRPIATGQDEFLQIKFTMEVEANTQRLKTEPAEGKDAYRLTFVFEGEPFDVEISGSALAMLGNGRASTERDRLAVIDKNFERIAGIVIERRLDLYGQHSGPYVLTAQDFQQRG